MVRYADPDPRKFGIAIPQQDHLDEDAIITDLIGNPVVTRLIPLVRRPAIPDGHPPRMPDSDDR